MDETDNSVPAFGHDMLPVVGLGASAGGIQALKLFLVGMPGLNGYDACQRIREQPWGRDMMIVALTGWGQEADRRKAKLSGFNLHVVKPIDPAVRPKDIVRLLAKRSSRGRKKMADGIQPLVGLLPSAERNEHHRRAIRASE